MNKYSVLALSLLLCLFLTQLSNAAQIIYLSGKVEQSNDGRVFHKVSAKVEAQSYVRTHEGWVIIELKNKTKLKLAPQSEVRIERDDDSAQWIMLKSGGVFTKVEPAAENKKRFKLSSKVATMGVRGTQFFMSYGKQKHKGHADEWMCVNEGTVEITDRITNKSKSVKEGQGVLVDAHEGLTDPKEYEWTKKLNWKMDSNEGKIESDVNLDSAYTNLRRIIYE